MSKIIVKMLCLFAFFNIGILNSQNYALLYDLNRDASDPNHLMYRMTNRDDDRFRKAAGRLNKAILAVENKKTVKNIHNEIINLYKKYFNFSDGYWWRIPMGPEYNMVLKPFENTLNKIRNLEAEFNNMHSEKYLESNYSNVKEAKQRFQEALDEAREKYKNDPGFLEESRSIREEKILLLHLCL